jgi:hypothetical protein
LILIPSTTLVRDHIPESCDTVAKKQEYIKVWSKEFLDLYKKQGKYDKLTKSVANGGWDFDLLNDMIYSFWILTAIKEDHPKHKMLKEAGIAYARCPTPAITCHTHTPFPSLATL